MARYSGKVRRLLGEGCVEELQLRYREVLEGVFWKVVTWMGVTHSPFGDLPQPSWGHVLCFVFCVFFFLPYEACVYNNFFIKIEILIQSINLPFH